MVSKGYVSYKTYQKAAGYMCSVLVIMKMVRRGIMEHVSRSLIVNMVNKGMYRETRVRRQAAEDYLKVNTVRLFVRYV